MCVGLRVWSALEERRMCITRSEFETLTNPEGCRLARFVFTTCDARNGALGCANLHISLGDIYAEGCLRVRFAILQSQLSPHNDADQVSKSYADQERQFFCRVSK